MRDERPELSVEQAEYAALEELGDPDRLAAGYTGKRLQLIGPELYPAYVRVLKAVLLSVVPVVVIVLAIVEAIDGQSVADILGGAIWNGLHPRRADRLLDHPRLRPGRARFGDGRPCRSSSASSGHPKQLPQIPSGSIRSVGELVSSLVWLALIGAAIVWQQFRSPIGDQLPMLDPDLWSFWLPLILALLVVEMAFEVVKYRAGSWSRGLATANVVLRALFAAPIVYLAATDKLLNPAAVAEIQDGWPGFDPATANTVVIVAALLIWAWDSIDGWRKALAE